MSRRVVQALFSRTCPCLSNLRSTGASSALQQHVADESSSLSWSLAVPFETGPIQLAAEWTTSLEETPTVLDRAGVQTRC
jgi:hypothetical protein